MSCPNCSTDMKRTVKDTVTIDECQSCQGIWITKDHLDELKAKEDRFIRWLDIPLWKEDKEHQMAVSEKGCPQCGKKMYQVNYRGHEVILFLCMDCQGVWLEKGELEKLIAYLEDIVTDESIEDFIKDLGNEAAQLLQAKSDLVTEVKDVSTIMKLIEYRIFSKFPVLSQLASRVPLI
ncbi:MAG: zf-TFIIB domain-containing protein [Candidatus Ancaeobacter aquaticus]|nr:zf-TFIIB domain-containing protein [Candidatus Ancaeobacter aquaticus]